MSKTVNDSEKPDLEKDHKEFLKMKENLINNKNEMVSEDDPIAKEMKAGKKPDKSSVEKGQSQEGFSNQEGFSFKIKIPKLTTGKPRWYMPIFVFFGSVFLIPFIAYYSVSFLALLRGFKTERMVSGLDKERSPYTNIGARTPEFAFEEQLWSMKRHGFPYNFHEPDYPNSLFSIFSRYTIESWVLARHWTDYAIQFARNIVPYSIQPNYSDAEKSKMFHLLELLNVFVWTPLVLLVVLAFGILLGPLLVSLKAVMNSSLRYKEFPFIDFKSLWATNIYFGLNIIPYYALMPIYLLWYVLIKPWNTLHATGNSDWIKHILQKNYIWIFAIGCIASAGSVYAEYKNTDKMSLFLIPLFLSVFFPFIAWGGAIPWWKTIKTREGNVWNFSVPAASRLSTLLYSSKGKDKEERVEDKDPIHNILWPLESLGIFNTIFIYLGIGSKQTNDKSRKKSGAGVSSPPKINPLFGSIAKAAIKSTPQGRAAMAVTKKAVEVAKVAKVAKAAKAAKKAK